MRKKFVGQLISLTRNIWLAQPTTECGYFTQFRAGKPSPLVFSGGFVLSWWYTKSSFQTVENIAFMILELIDFADYDLDSVKRTITEAFKEICLDQRIFAADDVCFSRKRTLYDCRSTTNPAEFGSLILDEIIACMKSQALKRCTIYVAPRVSGPSFQIPGDGLCIINRVDAEAWNDILRRGYQTGGWNPSSGCFAPSEETPFAKLKYDYVFVSEDQGTLKGTNFAGLLKLRRLFAVMFAVICSRNNARLTKSSADPYRICMQLPEASGRDALVTISEIAPLLPYYITDHALTAHEIAEVQAWFAATRVLCPQDKSRIEKGAHFINKAMNSNDIEAYVNYFIALDALFGQRNDVEPSIVAGVKSLNLDRSWEQKTSWLFRLRCELVHGGSRYVEEWPEYRRYYRHFGSRPDQDVERLSFAALLHAPSLDRTG